MAQSEPEAVVYLNGAYVPESAALIKVSDRGFLFADGVYEVTRAEPGAHLFLEAAHMRRLARGLRELQIDAPGLLSALPAVSRELLRARFGVVTRDDMRGLLAWLERQALVEVERLEGDLWAVTATRAGRDVARGAEFPGVAVPL